MKRTLILILAVCLAGCSPVASPAQATAAMATQVQAELQRILGDATQPAAPAPAEDGAPPKLTLPTAAPLPTSTFFRIGTPPPTQAGLIEIPSPAPRTATPEESPGLRFSGRGDSLLDIDLAPLEGSGLLHAVYNGGGDFAIQSFDGAGLLVDTLAQTNGAYDGWRVLDLRPDQVTRQLQVRAQDDWQLEIWPLSAAREVSATGTANGEGDTVLSIDGVAGIVTVRGNSDGQSLAVRAYGDSGYKSLVETDQALDASYDLEAGTHYLEIITLGGWQIELR
ncbi:MAG: hypothetical protein VB089_21175 [Anaerolineaceae bacterium]|nr:hypothetical protein [Anaerolineaceae bacterium]